jgi:hypothetical protein
MANYTVQDTQTGKTVTFAWDGEQPPTDTDMSEVFAAARGGSAPAQKDPFTVPASETEAMRKKFVADTGTTLQKVKEYIPSRKTIADFARPTLEGTGMIAGEMLGTPFSPVTGGASIPALGGLGYASGAGIANLIEGKPASFRSMVNDIDTGAKFVMGGQLAGKALSATATGVKNLRAKGLPFTDKRNTVKAGGALTEALETEVPLAAEANAAKQAETGKLMERVKAPVSPTLAQATGSPRVAAFEQSTSSTPEMMERLKYNDAQINEAALRNVTGAIGKEAPPIAAGQGVQATGVDIVDSITAARQPVKEAERAIWGEVPNYPMPTDNFTATADKLSKEPMILSAKKILFGHGGIMDYAKNTPKTVQGLQSIERTIGSEINKAARAGDNEAKRALTILKDSIRADFETMGGAAEAGDIALHNGSVVYPSKIQAELSDVTKRLAAEADTAQGAFSVQGNQAAASYVDRLTSDAAAKNVVELSKRKAALEDIIANLQPAEDVAAKYTAAKQFSKTQNFDRFNTGAVKDVLKAGDELTGYRLPPEVVPAKFFTPTGADDLIRAVGKDQAKQAMQPHLMEQLASKTVNADGVMAIPRAMAFIRQNRVAIQKLGMTKEVEQTIKSQVPAALRAQLEAKGVDVLGNPTMTARQAGKLLRDYGPAIKQLYGGDSSAIKSLQDYHKVLEVLGRNKNVSYSGGSTTAEKLNGANMVGAVASLATHGSGFVGSMARNIIRGFTEVAGKYSQNQVNALLQDAILNPESAKILMKVAKGAKIAPAVIDSHMATLGIYAVTPQSQEQNTDPLGIRQ